MKNKMMLLNGVLLFILSSGMSSHAADSSTANVNESKVKSDAQVFLEKAGNVDFYAVGKPSMLKVHGVNSSLTGQLRKTSKEVTGTFTIPMKDFSTGSLKLRDEHMRNKVFEVEKYPTAELSLQPIPLQGTEKSAPFKGKLKFHGVEKEVQGQVQLTDLVKELDHDATFKIKLSDFGIPPPEFAGMKIDDEISIQVKGKAILQ